MNSIRKRLLRLLLIGQLLAVLLTGTIIFFYVRGELEAIFDDRLYQLAHSVHIDKNFISQPPLPLIKAQENDDDFVIQVWQDDGTLLLLLNSEEGTPARAAEGFSNHVDHGVHWRSFVLRRGDRLIQASQPLSDRLEVSSSVAWGATAPVVALVFVLGLLVRVSINYGLGPLKKLTESLEKRRPYAMEPLATEGLPDEVLSLVLVLNSLLQRLDVALQSQRKFVADAAHELRTPLAAVQLQAQLLQKIDDPEERRQALDQMRAGTVRASHLAQQLLTLARLEPEDWQRSFATVNLSELIKTVVAEFSPAALKRQIDLGVSENEPATIMGDRESLRVMLGNLVDNALRYTPQKGRIDVALKQSGRLARLEVIDNGPGIPAAERQQVFARFYRCPGTTALGSGLGLAIVQEVVNHHNGEISLGARAGGSGLRVSIDFPLTEENPAQQKQSAY